MTAVVKRHVQESPLTQGEDEIINYVLDTTPWGGIPTNVSVVVFDITNADEKIEWVNVTSTVMPINNPTVSGDDITFSPLKLLTDARVYRMEMKFTTPRFAVAESYCLIVGGE